MKNILFITSRLPFPANSGRKSSLYNYCKIINNCGYNIIVASFDDGFDVSQKPKFIDKVILLPKLNSITKLKNLLFYSFFKKKFPMQVSLYWDKNIAKKIKEIVLEFNPSIVIADMVRTTEYLKSLDLNIYKIADLDDRLSLRYQRQLSCNINDVNPYGSFLNTLPKFFQKILMINFLKSSIMKNEIKLLKNYELEVGQRYDCTIFVSKKETEVFNKELGEKKAITIPIGVDIDYFKPNSDIKKDDYIGFLGSLNVAHNENAVKLFIKEIFPIILKSKPSSKFLIIGGGASEELKKFGNDSVIFTGMVDDVRDYLNKCKVFVCPLNFGSGIKTKNLEALAMGLPVVTSEIGAENIDAVDGKDWLVATNNIDFAKKVLMILDDDKLRKRLEKNSVDFIKKNFTWSVAEKQFKNILK